jgi:hypothetical protein
MWIQKRRNVAEASKSKKTKKGAPSGMGKTEASKSIIYITHLGASIFRSTSPFFHALRASFVFFSRAGSARQVPAGARVITGLKSVTFSLLRKTMMLRLAVNSQRRANAQKCRIDEDTVPLAASAAMYGRGLGVFAMTSQRTEAKGHREQPDAVGIAHTKLVSRKS